MRYCKSNLLLFVLVFIGLLVIFSYGMGKVAAASGDVIYVNNTLGNDNYDGTSATWTLFTDHGPKKSIKNATGTVNPNGIINIANGQYTGDDNTNITIDKDMIINGQSNKDTIINGTGTNWIFYISSGTTATLNDMTITDGTADVNENGGAIDNQGTLTVTGSNFNDNNANKGGAIYNDGGTLTLINSNFNANTVRTNGDGEGGAIGNGGTLTVTGSNFTGNTANEGGAIYNGGGTLTVTGSNFIGNTAKACGAIGNLGGTLTVTGTNFIGNTAYMLGGAIASVGLANVQFNRIVGNSAVDGNAIYNSGIISLSNNWWGSNAGPATGDVFNATVPNWLVLKLSANPTSIGKSAQSIIKAELTYTNKGLLANGYLPNGTAVKFTTTLGTITQASTVNGVAKANLSGGTVNGLAKVSAILDNQILYNTVTIDTIPPTVKTINPVKYAINILPNKIITITFSEPIKAGNKNIVLTNSKGIPTSITTSISHNVLTIKHTALLTNGKYTLTLHTGSITDLTGNPLASYGSSFTVDRIPPKIGTTTPTNLKTKISRISTIVIKFSENIKNSTYYNKITIKNMSTGKTVKLTKIIKGTTLYLKTTKRTANTWYTVTIPKAAIKDLAGNNLLKAYTFKFKTGK